MPQLQVRVEFEMKDIKDLLTEKARKEAGDQKGVGAGGSSVEFEYEENDSERGPQLKGAVVLFGGQKRGA